MFHKKMVGAILPFISWQTLFFMAILIVIIVLVSYILLVHGNVIDIVTSGLSEFFGNIGFFSSPNSGTAVV
jgi:preprotein translocase subunit SecG